MPSLVELMRSVLHILSQSDLQNKTHKNMTANYMAEVLLQMFETCEHEWEGIPEDQNYHIQDWDTLHIHLRCRKCFVKRSQIWKLEGFLEDEQCISR
jgi:hypothetical protein